MSVEHTIANWQLAEIYNFPNYNTTNCLFFKLIIHKCLTNLKRENIDYDTTIPLETFIIQVGLKDKNVSLVSHLRNFPQTIISHYFCK